MGKPKARMEQKTSDQQLCNDTPDSTASMENSQLDNQYRQNTAGDILSGFLATFYMFSNIISSSAKGNDRSRCSLSQGTFLSNEKQMQDVQESTTATTSRQTSERMTHTSADDSNTSVLASHEKSKTRELVNHAGSTTRGLINHEGGKTGELANLEESQLRALVNREENKTRTLTNREESKTRTLTTHEESKTRALTNSDESSSRVLTSHEESKTRTLANREKSKTRALVNCGESRPKALTNYEESETRALANHDESKTRVLTSHEESKTRAMVNQNSQNTALTNHEESQTTALTNHEEIKTKALGNREEHKTFILTKHKENKTRALGKREVSKNRAPARHRRSGDERSSLTPEIKYRCNIADIFEDQNWRDFINGLTHESNELNFSPTESKSTNIKFGRKNGDDDEKISTMWRKLQVSKHFKYFVKASAIMRILLTPNSKAKKVSSLKALKRNDVLMSAFLYQRKKLGKLRIPIVKSASRSRKQKKCKVTRNKKDKRATTPMTKDSATEAMYVECVSPTYKCNCVAMFEQSPVSMQTEQQNLSNYGNDTLEDTVTPVPPCKMQQRNEHLKQENSGIQGYILDYGIEEADMFEFNNQQEHGSMTSSHISIPSNVYQTKPESSSLKPFVLCSNSVVNIPSYHFQVSENTNVNEYVGSGETTEINSLETETGNVNTDCFQTADVNNLTPNVSDFQFCSHVQLKTNETRLQFDNSNCLINACADFQIDDVNQNPYSSTLNDEFQEFLKTF